METDNYRDLIEECRRLRRERDDLAKMCKRLVDELAAATFERRPAWTPSRCPSCGGTDLWTRTDPEDATSRLDYCRDCGKAWRPVQPAPECPCGSPAVTVRPTLMGQTEPACGACAAEPEAC